MVIWTLIDCPLGRNQAGRTDAPDRTRVIGGRSDRRNAVTDVTVVTR
jgi:hypothetical protein